jgi:hypothetical protein
VAFSQIRFRTELLLSILDGRIVGHARKPSHSPNSTSRPANTRTLHVRPGIDSCLAYGRSSQDNGRRFLDLTTHTGTHTLIRRQLQPTKHGQGQTVDGRDVVEITVGRYIAVYDKAGDGCMSRQTLDQSLEYDTRCCWGRKRGESSKGWYFSDVDRIDGMACKLGTQLDSEMGEMSA